MRLLYDANGRILRNQPHFSDPHAKLKRRCSHATLRQGRISILPFDQSRPETECTSFSMQMEVFRRTNLISRIIMQSWASEDVCKQFWDGEESSCFLLRTRRGRNTLCLLFVSNGSILKNKPHFSNPHAKLGKWWSLQSILTQRRSLPSSFWPKQARNTMCISSDTNGGILKKKPSFLNPHAKQLKWRCSHATLRQWRESLQPPFSPKQARNTMWLPFGLKGKYFGEKTSFLESSCKAEQGMMSPTNSDAVESLRSSFRPKEARNTVCIFSDANGSISKSKPHFSNPHAKLSKWRCFRTLLKTVKSLHSFLSTKTGEEISVAPIRCKWMNF